MAVYLQAVTLAERCFLSEVLAWVAFQRLPIAAYLDGVEIRESDDADAYGSDLSQPYLLEDETERLGLPDDPKLIEQPPEEFYGDPEVIAHILRNESLNEAERADFERKYQSALAHQKVCEEWDALYQRAIDYPASRIFVALRGGQLAAEGRFFEGADDEEPEVYQELPRPSKIEPTFWFRDGIDFNASSTTNGSRHYKLITCRTSDVLSLFPVVAEPVHGVEKFGDSYVLREEVNQAPKSASRGRPAYPWERFHLEVAALVQKGEMPAKKEAAIEQLQSWFFSELKVRPSRAAIGEKLTPYYARFVRTDSQKIR